MTETEAIALLDAWGWLTTPFEDASRSWDTSPLRCSEVQCYPSWWRSGLSAHGAMVLFEPAAFERPSSYSVSHVCLDIAPWFTEDEETVTIVRLHAATPRNKLGTLARVDIRSPSFGRGEDFSDYYEREKLHVAWTAVAPIVEAWMATWTHFAIKQALSVYDRGKTTPPTRFLSITEDAGACAAWRARIEHAARNVALIRASTEHR